MESPIVSSLWWWIVTVKEVQISIIYILFKSTHIQYISYTFQFHFTSAFFHLTISYTYILIPLSLHIHSLYYIPTGLRWVTGWWQCETQQWHLLALWCSTCSTPCPAAPTPSPSQNWASPPIGTFSWPWLPPWAVSWLLFTSLSSSGYSRLREYTYLTGSTSSVSHPRSS